MGPHIRAFGLGRRWVCAFAAPVLLAYAACSDSTPAANGSGAGARDAGSDHTVTGESGGAGGQGTGTGGRGGGTGTGGRNASGGARPIADGSADGPAPANDGGGNDSGGSLLDGPFVSGCGDGGVAIVNGVWPPSPATDPKCAPNCDVGSTTTCSVQCNRSTADPYLGAPCDSGCCASNRVTLAQAGIQDNNGPSWHTVGASAAGTVCDARPDGTYAIWNDLTIDCSPATYTSEAPDRTVTSPDKYMAGAAQFAFGKVGGKELTYVMYQPGPFNGPFPPPPAPARFGIGDGRTWQFGDVPDTPAVAAYNIAADATGAPLILTEQYVIRRVARGVWQKYCLPNPPQFNLVVDSAGAWYVIKGRTVSRRDPDGSWSSEQAPISGVLAVGGGTVHVANGTSYARRVGTSWEKHTFATTYPSNSPGQPDVPAAYTDMAIDGCGSPHIAVYATNGLDTFNSYYFRWTQAGWRSFRNVSACGYSNNISIAVAPQNALLAYADDCDLWATLHIPLR